MMKKDIYAKKKYGQNFLVDSNIIKKILNLIPDRYESILEIGPGRGALTKELLKKTDKLIAYEIDSDMVKILNKEIKEQNFNLINKDFLDSDLSNLPKSIVVANIPYYITTDILFKIFENKDKFSKAILMVQKEVGQRICAKPNTYDYSKLSVTSQYISSPKIEFIVPSNCFLPAPKVDSAIISLDFKDEISLNEFNEIKEFFKLCFSNRRKKLTFSLLSKYNKEKILNSYKWLNKNENVRIQELSVSEIVQLFNLLNTQN
ncbi:16S rRNA (adenine(1518)-N(6)/adenine(1519)-N(6))-dimethyltransferase RsmA [Mycoplasmopsis felis]|uniref:16S rRNA (adenine(1518)-N(6)/adenine(1519)-N(6))- dimethyltransferase RsmA n=1 Tax=Mycoplasmopsis felis TaxID=33923 RepID=UPI003B216A1B